MTDLSGFAWDPDKQARNLRDHGIDFADVPPLFDGPTLEYPDDAHSFEEARVRAIGLLVGFEVAVIYTDDAEGVRHLISPRRATPRERSAFYRAVGGQ